MTKRHIRRLLVAHVVLTTVVYAAPVHLRCEYVQNPLGLDVAVPHLSWQSNNTERNWRQSAYQIMVASNPSLLSRPDIWNSGKVNSADSVGIAYGGPKLQSRTRYYWTVRVWDSTGHESQSSEEAWWETGFLHSQEWQAKWIGWRNPEEEPDRAGIRWIWVAGQDAHQMPPKSVGLFRLDFDLAEKPARAALFLIARGDFVAKVNGHEVGSKKEWYEFDRQEIGPHLVLGKNTLEIAVTVAEPNGFGPDAGAKTQKGALAGLLKIVRSDGTAIRIPTDDAWQARMADETGWNDAIIVAHLDDDRLGEILPGPLPQPAALLRREFVLTKPVRGARLYVTALGSYRAYINGNRVGNDVLTPDFTDYTKRVLYQSYDVTSLLSSGDNVMGAILGDGWFGSGLAWQGRSFFFLPPPPRFMAQLEVRYTDGSDQTIVSDEAWKASPSPILRSEIYAGETYDARLAQAGWNKPGFDASKWNAAIFVNAIAAPAVAQIAAPARVVQTLAPKSVASLPDGVYVFDMGQNMVGWVKLQAAGPAGTSIRLRFAERLNSDGSIYRENLRNADATDTFILRGEGNETFTPHFTFHGFRYVEVTGYPGVPTLDSITGEVVSSVGAEPSGRLSTSSDLVNRMWSIGLWGQRGNFVTIPTDCPQRDERLGWMGDAGVFWRTGTFNFDIAAFSHKFMHDVTDAQTEDGAFTNVAPDALRPFGSEGAPGWGDAGVILPWTAWMQYGDESIIEENWDAMQRWMDFIAKANPDFVRKNGVGPNYADWLAPDEYTNKDLLATAYWALITHMMSDMAKATGRTDALKQYAILFKQIQRAYQAAYIKPSGEVLGGTQTSYLVTLYTGLAPGKLEPKMIENLVKDIEAHDWHLSTGFLGTPFLLFTLADHGRTDVAYRLLLNETYPSWGYMLSKGATTWWERWNGDSGDPAMNSYNHYAFGSVMAWVYRSVAGIDTHVDGPGYRQIVIHPHLDARITHARGEYDSVYGTIVSDWTGSASGPFSLKVTIPANTTAKIFLPTIANTHVTEAGTPVNVHRRGDENVVEVGSGTYNFEMK